jgi:hypothetical protein
MSKRTNHSPTFKAKVALAALSGEKTITELSMESSVLFDSVFCLMYPAPGCTTCLKGYRPTIWP